MDMQLVYDWFQWHMMIKAITDDITTNYVRPCVNVNCKMVGKVELKNLNPIQTS